MPIELITALIGVGGSALGSLVGILTSQKLTAYRIEKLEEKVNKHNNLIERTYNLEAENKVEREQIKAINHRLDDLERVNVNQ